MCWCRVSCVFLKMMDLRLSNIDADNCILLVVNFKNDIFKCSQC